MSALVAKFGSNYSKFGKLLDHEPFISGLCVNKLNSRNGRPLAYAPPPPDRQLHLRLWAATDARCAPAHLPTRLRPSPQRLTARARTRTPSVRARARTRSARMALGPAPTRCPCTLIAYGANVCAQALMFVPMV